MGRALLQKRELNLGDKGELGLESRVLRGVERGERANDSAILYDMRALRWVKQLHGRIIQRLEAESADDARKRLGKAINIIQRILA